MHVVRLFTGDDRRSHFEDLEVPMDGVEAALRSATVAVEDLSFRSTDSDWGLGSHPAPCRQFVVTLSGRSEVRCGDGSSRIFGPGDVMLADDLSGEGHTSRVLEGPRTALFVTVRSSICQPAWIPPPQYPA
jgi:hypothetical protein